MPLKAGVRLLGMKPELLFGLGELRQVFARHGWEMVITCGIDGSHSNASLHYAGCAADLRSSFVPKDQQEALRKEMQDCLPTDFDVILEPDHYHVEWQPKAPY